MPEGVEMRIDELMLTAITMLMGELGKDYLNYHMSAAQIYALYHTGKN